MRNEAELQADYWWNKDQGCKPSVPGTKEGLKSGKPVCLVGGGTGEGISARTVADRTGRRVPC